MHFFLTRSGNVENKVEIGKNMQAFWELQPISGHFHVEDRRSAHWFLLLRMFLCGLQPLARKNV